MLPLLPTRPLCAQLLTLPTAPLLKCSLSSWKSARTLALRLRKPKRVRTPGLSTPVAQTPRNSTARHAVNKIVNGADVPFGKYPYTARCGLRECKLFCVLLAFIALGAADFCIALENVEVNLTNQQGWPEQDPL